mmetsp:Transcript_13333/g.15535  ORF Transcript_13333/g.15535 Transcript_13333/m.15535 type:complete len:395 (+) Transcript_13333:123-1307(+)
MSDSAFNSCSNCGVESSTLKKCSHCKEVQYCDRECQLKHWKIHKPSCKGKNTSPRTAILQSMNKGKGLEDGLKINNTDDTEEEEQRVKNYAIEKASREETKFVRKAKKEGTPIFHMSKTSHGIVMAGQPVPEGVPESFFLKQDAITNLKYGAQTNMKKLGNLKFEASYKDYYDDIVKNEDIWMSFFNYKANEEHVEHTCGILGTLATIYRQRGHLQACEDVLNMETKVIQIYKRHSKNGGYDQVYNCDSLEFKMNCIYFNLYMQVGRCKECIPLFRSLCSYELQYNLRSDEQNWACLIETLLHKTPNKRNLQRLTNAEILRALNIMNKVRKSEQGLAISNREKERVALNSCLKCGIEEESIGRFKSCARCQKIFYCSKACQKEDWKVHKKHCKA